MLCIDLKYNFELNLNLNVIGTQNIMMHVTRERCIFNIKYNNNNNELIIIESEGWYHSQLGMVYFC